jgi:MSHA biogenesis protein MshP
MRRRQKGMSLIVAMFLIVVVALLAAFAIRIGTSQREQTNLQLASNRVGQAAHAGIEWATTRALRNNSCVNTTLTLTQGALNGYVITITCVKTNHAVGSPSYVVTSFAQYGRFGAAGYASKTMRSRF